METFSETFYGRSLQCQKYSCKFTEESQGLLFIAALMQTITETNFIIIKRIKKYEVYFNEFKKKSYCGARIITLQERCVHAKGYKFYNTENKDE